MIAIEIRNDGAPLSEDYASKGDGIKNVIERLDTMFGDAYLFTFSNLSNQNGVKTCIQIPYIPEDALLSTN